jgi:hypothetical protein
MMDINIATLAVTILLVIVFGLVLMWKSMRHRLEEQEEICTMQRNLLLALNEEVYQMHKSASRMTASQLRRATDL